MLKRTKGIIIPDHPKLTLMVRRLIYLAGYVRFDPMEFCDFCQQIKEYVLVRSIESAQLKKLQKSMGYIQNKIPQNISAITNLGDLTAEIQLKLESEEKTVERPKKRDDRHP